MTVLRQACSPWQALWALRLAGDDQTATRNAMLCGLEKATRERAEAQSFWPELWILAGSGVPSAAEGRGQGFDGNCSGLHGFYWFVVVRLRFSCWSAGL